MIEKKEIPENVNFLLEALEPMDSIKEEEMVDYENEKKRKKRFTGMELYENFHKIGMGEIAESVNVIPGGKPGDCRKILVVFIGNGDDFEKRILQAIKHCMALCKGITEYVVFYAMKWDSRIWISHRDSFISNNIIVVKKAWGEIPIRLC